MAHTQTQRGMTLIELMIALVLGLVVTGVVIEIFLSSKQMYRVQDARARLQENGRYAIQQLANNIKNAGYKGCATRSASVPVTNTLNDSNQYLWNFAIGIQGFDASGAQWTPPKDVSIDTPTPDQGTDILTIRTMSDPVIRVKTHPGGTPPGSAAITVNTPNQLQAFDIVMVTDCLTSAIFQISSGNPNTSGSVVHNTGITPDHGPGNLTTALGKNYAGAELVKLTTTSYYISGDSLFKRVLNDAPVELVEGVEDMQVLYGVDTNRDGSAEQYVTASTTIDWSEVVSVRVNLLLATLESGLTVDGVQTYSFNDTSTAASDTGLRAGFSRTISIRNNLP